MELQCALFFNMRIHAKSVLIEEMKFSEEIESVGAGL
jgi:hypothetical protein